MKDKYIYYRTESFVDLNYSRYQNRYVSTDYFFNESNPTDIKEVKKEHIQNGGEDYGLPDWCKAIPKENYRR